MNNIGAFDLKIWGSATSSYYDGILSQELKNISEIRR